MIARWKAWRKKRRVIRMTLDAVMRDALRSPRKLPGSEALNQAAIDLRRRLAERGIAIGYDVACRKVQRWLRRWLHRRR